MQPSMSSSSGACVGSVLVISATMDVSLRRLNARADFGGSA